MLNENSIRCFLTLAETLSFTETARIRYMTQQSVSKYIARMEEDLGFQLFIRTHHYVKLTKAGRAFYDLFTEYSKRFDQVVEQTQNYYQSLFSSLRIGYLEWLEISSRINDAFKVLKEKNRDLQFIGEKHPQHELNELFMQRKLDLIITYGEFAPSEPGLKKIRIQTSPLVLLVSPDHPKATENATADDFRTEPFIKAAAKTEALSESKNRARRQCRELGFSPSEILISPNLESAYMAAEFGQGVLVSTMLSRMSLHSNLKHYDLGSYEELLCFWHEDEEKTLVRAFAEAIKDDTLSRIDSSF